MQPPFETHRVKEPQKNKAAGGKYVLCVFLPFLVPTPFRKTNVWCSKIVR